MNPDPDYCYRMLRRAMSTMAAMGEPLKAPLVVGLSQDVVDDVNTLASKFPADIEDILWPSPEEARWPGMEQDILFVPPSPVKLKHVVLDHSGVPCDPYEDEQETESLLVASPRLRAVANAGGQVYGEVLWSASMHIHPYRPPTGTFQGWWGSSNDLVWGMNVNRNPVIGHMASSTVWEWCLLHVLAQPHYSLARPPSGLYHRNVHRMINRQKSEYRILSYGYHPTDTDSTGAPKAIVWNHRWGVSGHWRQQRVGPGRKFVKPTWVSPYLKQRHLPPDPRDTVYRADPS